ncbi:Alpha/beta hydrolase fold-3 [Ophiocordyceps camponoti-floridani]|uniref:Alpha/beta hydrolase fold-3 n=1 Tax=Ophiocordyceps camponoti-floridani TaxID=2030778 RepID=A0A8H4Q6L6_9HYPO|nr:Alpha/beta hydrolase fold-3 [Ophiocordyceps camponoti-floridani]
MPPFLLPATSLCSFSVSRDLGHWRQRSPERSSAQLSSLTDGVLHDRATVAGFPGCLLGPVAPPRSPTPRAAWRLTSVSVATGIASNVALGVVTPGLSPLAESPLAESESPPPPDYVNPLEASSRWYLSARASAVRYAASLGFSLSNRSDSTAPAPTRDLWLDSTLSRWSGRRKIKVDVWVPTRMSAGPRPAVIDLHGGGWILGQGTDDARWAGAVMETLDAVVFSVNYRLAPSYPFPIPIEDCVDAVLQIANRADELGIDRNSLFLSGFSAGATNALTSWLIIQDPSRWGYDLPSVPPTVAGLILFYPTLDITISRPEKRQMCARPELTLSPSLSDLIDASYVYPPIPRDQRTDFRLSPGLMSDELLQKLPPLHLCLCEYDMLLAEGFRFAQRLQYHNKHFSMRVVKGEAHGWDKPPPLVPKESVGIEYGEATRAVARWLGRDCETDNQSIGSKSHRVMRLLKRPSYLSFRSRSVR